MGKARVASPSAEASRKKGSRSKSPAGRNAVQTEIMRKDHPNHHDKFAYEFGGPIGAAGVVFGLPIVIYLLYFVCNKDVCLKSDLSIDSKAFFNLLPTSIASLSDLISQQAVLIYVGWMLFHVLLERILPGEIVEGVTLEDGSKLKYRMSGHLQFWITIIAMGHCIPVFEKQDGNDTLGSVWSLSGFRGLPLSILYEQYVQLITVSIIGSFILSIYLYVSSFGRGKILAKGGVSGNPFYDFFIGRELNPRVFGIDLKEFCELRPGLIGWLVLNLGMACQQIKNSKSMSLSMVLVCLFQGLYVWDALYQEKAILTTMDITTDGFGYMLAFGDLSWVPFIYSLQARYLVDHDPKLSLWKIILISCLHFVGLYIFRSANSQKDAFRRDPNSAEVAHLKFLETKRGTKLLISGWWGLARKINYTGDWLVSLSWCLLCGFSSPIPYFHAVYFFILLVHRAIRDDHMCFEKYGSDWTEYKKHVPYLFIPYVW